MAVADIHGSEQDPRAVKAALKFARDFKPQVRVIAGDLWNFAALRKGASEDERAELLDVDYTAGEKFADSFFSSESANHLMLGNHDVRVWDLLKSPYAERRALGQFAVNDIKALVKKHHATLWPYDARAGVLRLGHLKIIHGYHAGLNACVQHARIYNNCIFGHTHAIESYQVPGLDQREARSIGCLCKLDQDYINRKTGKLKWSHGFAYGWLFSDGTYAVYQARSIGGKFYASSNIKAY